MKCAPAFLVAVSCVHAPANSGGENGFLLVPCIDGENSMNVDGPCCSRERDEGVEASTDSACAFGLDFGVDGDDGMSLVVGVRQGNRFPLSEAPEIFGKRRGGG